MSQRVLLRQASYDVGGPILSMARSGDGHIAVLTARELIIVHSDRGVVARASSRGATALTADDRGAIAWGAHGALRIGGVASARGMITDRPVQAIERLRGGALALHTAQGQFVLRAGRVVERLAEVRIQSRASAPAVRSIVLGRGLVAVANGSTVVVAQAWGARRDV
jgi:hypothetical protein